MMMVSGGISLVLAYLLGSLPFAVWISKRFYGADIRTFGSGNAGSTNMYRTFGFKAGFITQLLDVLKGVFAALIPHYFPVSDAETLIIGQQIACGLAAVLGHTYPIFADFKGGKGVNTILGMMLAIHPAGSAAGLGIFLLTLLAGKMVSLASMCAVSSFPVFLLVKKLFFRESFSGGEEILLYAGLILALWVIYTHRENIGRIRSGTERKVDLVAKLRGKQK
jgi:glycerol-3-phosphate acyltransferase PlsY